MAFFLLDKSSSNNGRRQAATQTESRTFVRLKRWKRSGTMVPIIVAGETPADGIVAGYAVNLTVILAPITM